MRQLLLTFCILLSAVATLAQSNKTGAFSGSMRQDLVDFVTTPAISGYEGQLGEKVRSELKALHPTTDNLGDMIITIGSGAPHRLIVTPIDEPGFVASEITEDGYIRVQRLPQSGLPPIFNQLYSAQPVKVLTASGNWIDGVVAGLSVHLEPGHTNPAKSDDLEKMYIDIGASSAAEVRKAGVDILSPIVINRQLGHLAEERVAGASVGDRFGAAELVEILRDLDPSKLAGTLTFAFVVQQRTGARGLQRILTTVKADEMIFVGRLTPGGPVAGVENVHRAPRREPGSGALIGLEKTDGSLAGLPADLKQIAEESSIPFATDYSSGLIPSGYLPSPPLPAKWAHIGIATAWPDTPAEMIDVHDLKALASLLRLYLGVQDAGPHSFGTWKEDGMPSALGAPGMSSALGEQQSRTNQILKDLIETYGVSNHEAAVRERVKGSLPPWAKPVEDDAGNLILHAGTASAATKSARILIVAHMDEIGFEVKSISKDGRLEVEWAGGGELSFFAGHPAVVHSSVADHDSIMELPNGWDEPKFEWPREPGKAIRVDVGARTPEEVEKLGIKTGDWVTIPKAYRPLLGDRANGRSFDDRVGDAALVAAVWALGGPLKDREVTFVWSTGEELGLVGAGALAKRLAAEGKEPDFTFAVDTFVSSDSPLESKRIADAEIGKGFVVRAVDNSNIVPTALVEKVVKLARANKIPVQYGVTGGGNDGSAFVRYGSVDIALGWPLRYSHSPAEVIDTRDVESLARIVAAVARSW